jgi:hypothetical protein
MGEFEDKFEKWLEKKFIKIHTLVEHDTLDKIVVKFYRLK